jgi:hypothetical protein
VSGTSGSGGTSGSSGVSGVNATICSNIREYGSNSAFNCTQSQTLNGCGSINTLVLGYQSYVTDGFSGPYCTVNSAILGGQSNQLSCTVNSFIGGGYNNVIEGGVGNAIVGGESNYVGSTIFSIQNSAIGGGQGNYIGGNASAIPGGYYNAVYGSCAYSSGWYTTAYGGETAVYNLDKWNNYFAIEHPDPTKKNTMRLVHAAVESPSAGENIYRYQVTTQNCQATLQLPDYYKFLNNNDYVSVTPSDNLGKAYGIMDSSQTKIDIFSNEDGKFDVIIIGTRKDKDATQLWKGAERFTSQFPF